VRDAPCGSIEANPTLPRGEQRTGRRQLRRFRGELGIGAVSYRIDTEQRVFAEVQTYAAMIELHGFGLPFLSCGVPGCFMGSGRKQEGSARNDDRQPGDELYVYN
jgi:hypothetical protein